MSSGWWDATETRNGKTRDQPLLVLSRLQQEGVGCILPFPTPGSLFSPLRSQLTGLRPREVRCEALPTSLIPAAVTTSASRFPEDYKPTKGRTV